jgi:adenylate cyclase
LPFDGRLEHDRLAHEIEQKFLVASEAWKDAVASSERIVDGLLATSKGRKVRVRLYGERATLTIKTRKKGRTRLEFEYEVPRADAEQLLRTECGASVLAKVRHYVPFEGFTWEVDVYEAPLDGVILAEVELDTAEQEAPRPPWIGREVTNDPAFRKQNLFAARARRKFTTTARPAKPKRRSSSAARA